MSRAGEERDEGASGPARDLEVVARPGWRRLLEDPDRTVWEVEPGLALTLGHDQTRLLVDPFLIADFRADLRLLAARRGGGLVSCELRAGWGGVIGLTKEPQRRVGRGVTYRGHALVPTAHGRAELELIAHEGQETGERERSVREAAFALAPPERWAHDPYGFVYPQAGAGPLPTHRFPPGLLLACAADEEGYDLLFPEHPLSRLRTQQAGLELAVREPCDLRVPRGRSESGGARFFRPLGFLPAGEAPTGRGRRYRRRGFGGLDAELWVAHREADPELALDPAWVGPHLEDAAPEGFSAPPRARSAACGAQRGVLAEYEALIAGEPRFACCFFLPWEGHVLEVHRRGPADDWARARADLEALVLSLDESLDRDTAPAPLAALVSFNGRRRAFRALAWVAWCDGELAAAEGEVLEAARRELDLGVAEARELLAEGRAAERLPLGRRAAEREVLLRWLIRVVAADGVLDPNERRRLEALAPLLGCRPQDLLRAVQEALL
ncbi:MAG: TerB family tellurite resistance protein [Planctomycetota bacterium]